jgi:hypothetical protein
MRAGLGRAMLVDVSVASPLAACLWRAYREHPV